MPAKFTEPGMESRERIMNFLQKYINENGYSPSVREIADGVFLCSSSTVQRHLEILKAQGEITWNPHLPRTIRILERGDKHV
jgi:repressor LexA